VSGQTPSSGWQLVMDLVKFVLGEEDVFRRFRQLVWLIAGVALGLAVIAAIAIAVAPQSALTPVLGGAAIAGGVSTIGSLAAYRKLKRRRDDDPEDTDGPTGG
jgi:hypothetical protein